MLTHLRTCLPKDLLSYLDIFSYLLPKYLSTRLPNSLLSAHRCRLGGCHSLLHLHAFCVHKGLEVLLTRFGRLAFTHFHSFTHTNFHCHCSSSALSFLFCGAIQLSVPLIQSMQVEQKRCRICTHSVSIPLCKLLPQVVMVKLHNGR